MSILNYKTYQEAKEKFKWSDVWKMFDGTRDNFNIAHECIDRHVGKGTAARIKFSDGHTEEYSFDEICSKSSKFANALNRLSARKGDRVGIMLDPSLEFYISFFGILKCGAIVVPFYPQFGPEAIEYRLKDSKPKVMITTEDRKKLFDSSLVEHVIAAGPQFNDLIVNESEKYQEKNETTADDVAVFQYTSGTTRKFPEAVKHYHKSVVVAVPPTVFVLGLRREDRYFTPFHPSWGGGAWYGTIAPLALGITIGAYSGKFDSKIFLDALQEFKINNLSAPPTVYRMVKNSGLLDQYDLKLDKLSYSMEPMDRDTFEFFKKKFGVSLCSYYGSTEAGPAIVNYNGYPDYEVKEGSLGKAMLGVEVAIIDEQGNRLPPGKIGEIAIKRKDGWFRIKDCGVCDEEGYFWHKGRADDVIISSGWTISPSEVECALQDHEAVEEAVVVGAPDKERGQIIRAYLKVKKEPSEALEKEIVVFVKERLSKHEYPRAIQFVDDIPKTTGGKIDRRKIKEWAGMD